MPVVDYSRMRIEAKVTSAEPGTMYHLFRDGKTYAFPVVNWIDFGDERRVPVSPFKLGSRGVLKRDNGTFLDERTEQEFDSIDEVRKHYYDPDLDRPELWGGRGEVVAKPA